ncbi:SDR family oxidoreductase [Pseudomonas fluorescens]|nr:SDR family oxidoreductase [Pseudomonas fluorescens]
MFGEGGSAQRVGTLGDIAAAVRFLASYAASVVTREIMDVDGGYMRG